MLPGRSKMSVLAFLLPPLLLYVVAVLLPIVQSLYLSLFSWDGITDAQFVGLDNYVRMFTRDPVFWRAFGNALVYLAVCLFFQLGVALFVANLLSYAGRGKEVAKTLYLLPAIISTVAIAFLFQRVYSFEPPGLINQLLDLVGLGGAAKPWLSDTDTVLVAVSGPEGWRFAFINATTPAPAQEGRLRGYREALESAGLPFDPELVMYAFPDQEGGYSATEQLLQLDVTAVFCYNDRMAMGLYDGLRQRGLSIPEDIAVVGFDNQEVIAAHLRPPLSTVGLPHYELGAAGVRLLLGLEQVNTNELVRLDCPPVERESVGGPAAVDGAGA